MTNAALADLAASRAAGEPSVAGGTVMRRAALCAAVALRTTSTPAAARAALRESSAFVRAEALALISELEDA